MSGPVVVALTEAGGTLARRIARELSGAEVHGLAGRVSGVDLAFAQTALHLRQLFQAGRPIVAVMAAGALVRILAPVLSDKHDDPPLLQFEPGVAQAIPDLAGLSLDDAVAVVEEAGAGYVVVGVSDGEVPEGQVVDQKPAPGTEIGPGDLVTLIVSR